MITMRRFISITILILAASLALIGPARPAAGQDLAQASASDLISAVNAVRAQYGLTPYKVDGSLMAAAQEQSDYQASIGQTSHTRADGSTPATLGFIENIMAGYQLAAQSAVNTWTKDYWHLNTLTGIDSGYIGAGAAAKDEVNYYTLDVRRAPGGSYITPAGSSAAEQPGQPGQASTPASEIVSGVETAVPAEDGSIIHKVQPGQSAWSIAIAYNLKIADLIALNNLAPTPVIFAGQKLVIRAAFTPTISPTLTKTPRPPTRTPGPTDTARPPSATPSLTPTATATRFSLENALPVIPSGSQRVLGIALILVSGLGLALVVIGSLRKK